MVRSHDEWRSRAHDEADASRYESRSRWRGSRGVVATRNGLRSDHGPLFQSRHHTMRSGASSILNHQSAQLPYRRPSSRSPVDRRLTPTCRHRRVRWPTARRVEGILPPAVEAVLQSSCSVGVISANLIGLNWRSPARFEFRGRRMSARSRRPPRCPDVGVVAVHVRTEKAAS